MANSGTYRRAHGDLKDRQPFGKFRRFVIGGDRRFAIGGDRRRRLGLLLTRLRYFGVHAVDAVSVTLDVGHLFKRHRAHIALVGTFAGVHA